MKRKSFFLPTMATTFQTISIFLILIVLPMSFLYYFDSYLLISTKQHLLDTAVLILILTFLSFLAALLAGTIYLILSLFLKRETAARTRIVFNLLGFGIAVYEFLKTTRLWLVKTFPDRKFNLEMVDITVIILAVAAVVLIFYFRKSIWPRLREERTRWFKAVVVLACLALVMVAGQVFYTSWIDARENKTSGTDQNVKAPPRPNVILITFDALTAEDMSLYGYPLKTTPHLDAFAGESYLFQNMYANANWTRPSTTSILTGTYPWTHRQIHLGKYNCFLPEKLRNKDIAAVLKNNGYRTAAVVSNLAYGHPVTNGTYRSFDYVPLNTVWPDFKKFITTTMFPDRIILFFLDIGSTAYIWLDNMKSTYVEFISAGADLKKWDTELGAPADVTFDLAYRYLRDAEDPFFLWVHVMPPHSPYLPKKRFQKHFLNEDVFLTGTSQMIPGVSKEYLYTENLQPAIGKLRLRYDELILDTDNEFGLFLSKIKAAGILDTSVVIVSSDHGESFERGYVTHGGPMLYNNLIQVPLIIRTPGQTKPAVINRPAEQVDLAPTILDLLGIAIPDWMDGESLKPFLEKGAATGKPKFSMQLDENSVTGKIKKGVVAVIRDDYKLIYNLSTQKSELYHLAKDPRETNNLAETDPQRSAFMKQLILNQLARVNLK